MIQTISYVYDCGRWVPAKHPRSIYDTHRALNGFFQSSYADVRWRGDDLASRTVEGLGKDSER